jgi:hypothetical protein
MTGTAVNGYWDFCAFRFPGLDIFFKLETNLTYADSGTFDGFPRAWELAEWPHSDCDGYFRLSQHDALPRCHQLPRFGFEMMNPFPDPDASSPDWDGSGQWRLHNMEVHRVHSSEAISKSKFVTGYGQVLSTFYKSVSRDPTPTRSFSTIMKGRTGFSGTID